jgi:hypothetical protein
MSVLRQQNWLGQQRVDIPHLRSVGSSICADFDVLAGRMLAGLTPIVIQGFETITVGMTGQPATNLQISVANSTVMHPLATESGTIFWVPSDRAVETLNATNSRVRGGFTANAVNYIGIDLLRTADASTSDLVQFINPQTDLETPKSVPLGRTLDYVIYISTQDFSSTPGLCPIAVITTDSSNNIASGGIVDARELMFRLGSGGSIPNATYAFPWPGGRTETGNNTDFSVGDKVITSFKGWANSVMTRLWELGGGSYWYTPTNVFNIELARTGSPFVSNGQFFEWDGTNLHWKGLVVLFDNTVGWNNTITDQTTSSPGLTDLADGDCLYVDLVRGSNATISAAKASLAALGSPTVPGSRVVIAWRKGAQVFTRNSDFAINTAFAVATTAAVGVVKLQVTPGAPGAPVVFNLGTNSELTVASTSTVPAIAATAVSGPVLKSSSTLNNITALHRSVNNGKVLTNTDYLGFRSGWIEEYTNNHWGSVKSSTGSVNTLLGGWTTRTTTNCRVGHYGQIEGGQLGSAWATGAYVMQLQSGRANTDNISYYSPGYVNMSTSGQLGTVSSNTIWVSEWTMGLGNTPITGFNFFAGFASSPSSSPFGGSIVYAGVRFKANAPESDTTLHLVSSDGVTTTAVDLGITPQTNTTAGIHRYRLELHGSNSPYGQCIRLFVDGTLFTKTTNMPVGSTVPDMAMLFWAESTSTPGTSIQLEIGPVRLNSTLLGGIAEGSTGDV